VIVVALPLQVGQERLSEILQPLLAYQYELPLVQVRS